MIPEGMCRSGQVNTASCRKSGMIGVFCLEFQLPPGNGKFERTDMGIDRDAKESSNAALNFLKTNANRLSGSVSAAMKDNIINYQDLQRIGMTGKLAIPTLIAFCTAALGKPVQNSLMVLEEISIGGSMIKADELASTLQVCLDSGAKRTLIQSTSFKDFVTAPPDLRSTFQTIPSQGVEDAVFKALYVE